MELFIALLVIIFMLGLFAALFASIKPGVPISKAQACENKVSRALNAMNLRTYTTFNNLILRSNGNTNHTEIDHVVVSPYGIFCIETKSHQGSIYGYRKSASWKQYLGNKSYELFNPYRQNYKHIKALEALLGNSLKAPIHSYVVFPNAHKVMVDGVKSDMSIQHVVEMIERHTTPLYDLATYEHILKTLAYASTQQDTLAPIHRQEVRTYLGTL